MLLYLCLTVLYDYKENNVIKWGIPVVAVPPNQKKKKKPRSHVDDRECFWLSQGWSPWDKYTRKQRTIKVNRSITRHAVFFLRPSEELGHYNGDENNR